MSTAAGGDGRHATRKNIVDLLAALVITMTVTVYAPEAGGINGNGTMADGTAVQFGAAACGYRYAFGTVFEFTEDMSEHGLPQVVECRDRGSYIGPSNLDIALLSRSASEDVAAARRFGRRRLPIRLWANWDAYHAHYSGAKAGRPAPDHISMPGQTRLSRAPSRAL